jgi:hypothetical protein
MKEVSKIIRIKELVPSSSGCMRVQYEKSSPEET